MPIIRSRLDTRMAYDGGEAHLRTRAPFHIELIPGDNEVTEDQLDDLRHDSAFMRHAERGFYAVPRTKYQPQQQQPKEQPKEQPKPEVKAKSDPAMDKFVADFLASPPEAQEAMAATLTPEQKAAIEAVKK